jgi:hypothetical protein
MMRLFSSRRESITADLRARAARWEQRYGRKPSQREMTQLAEASTARGWRVAAAAVRTTAGYTAEQCLKDWLQALNTQAEITVTGYRIMARHLVGLIGNVKLVDLRVRDVQFALGTLAERLSTRSVRLARMILIQSIRNAMVNDLVVRNVAELAAVPAGQPGRPPVSLNRAEATS